MKMLVVGAGVIGTVYGAYIAAAGSKVSVLSHGPRTSEVAAAGLSARDVLSGGRVDTEADVVPDASGDYDLVLVAVRRDQLSSGPAESARPQPGAGRPKPRAARDTCGPRLTRRALLRRHHGPRELLAACIART